MAAQWTLREIDAPDKPYLTLADVMALFGFDSPDSVYAMVRRGQLPESLKRGGSTVWGWKDVVLANLLMEAADRIRSEDPPRPNPTESDRKRPKTDGS